jgi:glycerol uptake facilitator-like aquaporin
MAINVLLEFLGTLLILYGSAEFGWLPIVLAITVVAKSLTMSHLNPAVTLWYYLSGKIDATTSLMYVASQCLAAFVVFKAYH